MTANMDTMTYYSLLGVAHDATPEEIKSAYRRLAKSLHPDRNGGNSHTSHLFTAVQTAYDTLRDPERRRKYDSSLLTDYALGSQSTNVDDINWDDDEFDSGEEWDVAPVAVDIDPSWLSSEFDSSSRKRWALYRNISVGVFLLALVGLGVFSFFKYGIWAVAGVALLSLFFKKYITRAKGKASWIVGTVIASLISIYAFVDVVLDDPVGGGTALDRALVWLVFGLVAAGAGFVLNRWYGLPPKQRVYNFLSEHASDTTHATAQNLEKFAHFPGAVVVSGLRTYADGEPFYIDHAIVCGRKVAIVNSVSLDEGRYSWDRSGVGICKHDSMGERFYGRSEIPKSVSALLKNLSSVKQKDVQAWTLVHGNNVSFEASPQGVAPFARAHEGIEEIGQWFLSDNNVEKTHRKYVEELWKHVNTK